MRSGARMLDAGVSAVFSFCAAASDADTPRSSSTDRLDD